MRRLRVLHAIHDFLPRHRAGSEIYTAELTQALAGRHHVTVLCSDYDPTRPHGHVTWRMHGEVPVVEVVNNWLCRTFHDTYRPAVVSERMGEVLEAVEPDVLHVHNLLNLSFDLVAQAKARGIPVVATLHDYTLVCPSGGQRVHRAESHVCRDIDAARCARCFPQSQFATMVSVGGAARAVAASGPLRSLVGVARAMAPGLLQAAARTAQAARPMPVTAADILERLAGARAVFDAVDLFVAPSASIAEEFGRLGLEASKIVVSAIGFRPMSAARAPSAGSPARAETASSAPVEVAPLRVGFVGTLVWHKGVHVLVDAVRHLPAAEYEVVIHGDVATFPDYVADLRRRAEGLPIRFAGRFSSDAIADIYGQLDVVVVPSLWLENSPLVIHEAFQAGVPVIGSHIGGTADLVRHGEWGLLFEPGSPTALADALRFILRDRRCLRTWASKLPPVKSIEQDAAEWEVRYRQVTAARAAQPA